MAPGNGSAYHAGGGRSKAAVAAKMPSRRDAGGGGGGGGMEQERAVQDPGLKDYVGLFLSSVLPAVVVGPVWSDVVFLGERIHLVLWLEMRPPPPWLGMWTFFVVWLCCRFGGVRQALDLITDFVAF